MCIQRACHCYKRPVSVSSVHMLATRRLYYYLRAQSLSQGVSPSTFPLSSCYKISVKKYPGPLPFSLEFCASIQSQSLPLEVN